MKIEIADSSPDSDAIAITIKKGGEIALVSVWRDEVGQVHVDVAAPGVDKELTLGDAPYELL